MIKKIILSTALIMLINGCDNKKQEEKTNLAKIENTQTPLKIEIEENANSKEIKVVEKEKTSTKSESYYYDYNVKPTNEERTHVAAVVEAQAFRYRVGFAGDHEDPTIEQPGDRFHRAVLHERGEDVEHRDVHARAREGDRIGDFHVIDAHAGDGRVDELDVGELLHAALRYLGADLLEGFPLDAFDDAL